MDYNPQLTHQRLIELLNERELFNFKLKYRTKAVSSSEVHEEISVGEACNIGALISVALNMTGGSIGDIDLYQLLQAYLTDTGKRKQINEVLNTR